MKKVITKRILKNMLYGYRGVSGDPEMLGFHDIAVNGVKKGCSGFLRYSVNGGNRFVYVDTESSCLASLSDKILYRIAKHEKDYCGETNHYYKPTFRKTHEPEMGDAFRKLACNS